jgi:glutaredoxin
VAERPAVDHSLVDHATPDDSVPDHPAVDLSPAPSNPYPQRASLTRMLELYQAEGCPFSAEVREAMTNLGLSYVVHNPRLPGDEGGDVLNELTYEELLELGGEDELPFLVDYARGERHYGSDEIIEYVENHYA